MKKYALIVSMLTIITFAACGNGNENINDADIIEDIVEVYEPQQEAWALPAESGDVDIVVDGRNVSISFETYAENISVMVLDAQRSEIVYIEQFQGKNSYSFVLGDNLSAGEYTLIVGGEGTGLPIIAAFTLED